MQAAVPRSPPPEVFYFGLNSQLPHTFPQLLVGWWMVRTTGSLLLLVKSSKHIIPRLELDILQLYGSANTSVVHLFHANRNLQYLINLSSLVNNLLFDNLVSHWLVSWTNKSATKVTRDCSGLTELTWKFPMPGPTYHSTNSHLYRHKHTTRAHGRFTPPKLTYDSVIHSRNL